MNSERIKEILKETAYPESRSVYIALLQVWNECQQENNTTVKTIVRFKMTAISVEDKVIFNGAPCYNEIEEYFENSCGGVYQWWI